MMVLLTLCGAVLATYAGWRIRRHKQRTDRHSATLEAHFAYYRQLGAAQKRLFAARVQHFLEEKHFDSRGGLAVTDERKTLVAACAVQLAFGLPPTYLSHFHTIILYPDRYYSPLGRNYHVGEVNEGGVIVLSWRHFTDGYFHPHDSRNVGLHEMAHALLLQHHRQGGTFLAPGHVQDFFEQARHEYRNLQAGRPSVLRPYAGTNVAELFAVAVETFFENPGEMDSQAPGLYRAMTRLLNQNPLQQVA